MKRSKQELKQYVSDSIKDNDDLVISLLEDIEDSMMEEGTDTVINETLKRENEELKWKLEDLTARYKERFLKGEDEEDKEDKEDKKEDGMKEEEIIDIKEI